eukprot:Skav211618  [mRNA]  locus=scaffold3083:370789:373484:- [translate_table: standard]
MAPLWWWVCGPYADFDREVQDWDARVCAMRWGLVPSFAKNEEDAAKTHGAESRNLWKRLLDKRRCVVLFDGFYEWKAQHDARVQQLGLMNRGIDQ